MSQAIVSSRNMVHDEVLPAGEPWSRVINQGQVLRIVDLEGKQGVDFLCYNAHNYSERYHAPNTLKASVTVRLGKGHTLYSDEARPLFKIIEDTCGFHDTIGGCCSAPSNQMLYGVSDCPGCRENFLEALALYGMDRRDIVPNINFFCNVPIYEAGRLADRMFEQSHSKAGDFIELEAQMDALAVISNCPQINNPCNNGKPSPIRLKVFGGA
ncbi:MAG: DUF1989 domain-containing protein [Gammaproteobacteria bacterium]|nr:DUF1989 domain-containing protein [Gammaproteobacteria bacterium]